MKIFLVCALALLAAGTGSAQRLGHDPLTGPEIDQLRDTAQEPNKRLKLYVEFARARMDSIDKLADDPKAKDRASQLHDLLQDFSTLMDEIADNVDMYSDQHWDIRKSLRLVIEGDSEFQLKLKKLAQSTDDAALAGQADQYKFVLHDALDSLNSNGDDARHVMQEQNELAKDKKLKKENAQPVGHPIT